MHGPRVLEFLIGFWSEVGRRQVRDSFALDSAARQVPYQGVVVFIFRQDQESRAWHRGGVLTQIERDVEIERVSPALMVLRAVGRKTLLSAAQPRP